MGCSRVGTKPEDKKLQILLIQQIASGFLPSVLPRDLSNKEFQLTTPKCKVALHLGLDFTLLSSPLVLTQVGFNPHTSQLERVTGTSVV